MLARQPMPEMTFDEYVEWEARQEEKWELVNGRPVPRSARWDYDPVTGMAGATTTHNAIVTNIIVALSVRLRGGPCWASPSDLKVRSREKSARYPDVMVNCGPNTSESTFAQDPRVAIEVLSKSNSFPVEDYHTISSLQQVVYVKQNVPIVLSWTRHDPFWPREDIRGLERTLAFPALGFDIPLSEIYDGIEFADDAV